MKQSVMMGTTVQAFELPDQNLLGVLKPNEVKVNLKGEASVRDALKNPIASLKLNEIVKPGEKIAIITSDITRPLPSYKILPAVLDELELAGCQMEDITIVFALGSHRKQTEQEQRKLVGDDVSDRVHCVDGDLNDVVHLGKTKGGTPVDVVRVVAEADRRIGIANVEYHYFAGYSGGAKAIMPGVSTREAIQANHSRMVEEGAITGNVDTNPVRLDIEEAVRDYCPLDCILNVVLNEEKEIIYSAFGDFVEAHRVACKFLDRLYRVQIPQKADIVIVSQGGAPKDLNLYQTQKALDNAKHAVRDDGIIILVGSCREGMGEKVFEEWMTTAKRPEDLVTKIRENFQLGGHKAAAIAMVLEIADIYLVSEMEEEFVKSIFLNPFNDVQTALDAAFDKLGSNANVLIMPYGGSTLPHLPKE
ncbi:MAG: nickel-dependent lactate racemase [Clostridiaceae bacterium]|nr:nickel-dependent lactate racemase [Clostridiaceae bacterium]